MTCAYHTSPIEDCCGCAGRWDRQMAERAIEAYGIGGIAAATIRAAIAEIDRQAEARAAAVRRSVQQFDCRTRDLAEASETYQAILDLVAHIGDQLDAERIKAVRLQDEVAGLTERQQKHLQMIASLSQSTPLQSELEGWEGQRAKLIAEVGSLRAQIKRMEFDRLINPPGTR